MSLGDVAMRRGSQTGWLLLLAILIASAPTFAAEFEVAEPPRELRLDGFYKKHVDAGGLPAISSHRAPDEALIAAAEIVAGMLAKRPDLHKALADRGARIAVIGEGEQTTDIPEHRWLKPKKHWDKRARGLGGTADNPVTSCGAENLLGGASDPYAGESILIHEFAHTVQTVGMAALDERFDGRLQRLYGNAIRSGLWAQTYAAANHKEYWAEGVQCYFDCNARAVPADGIHNHVRNREQLEEYDPGLAELIDEVFGANPWRWTPAGAHKRLWQNADP